MREEHEAGDAKCSVISRVRRAQGARLSEMSQAIFVKVIYIGAPYRDGYSMTSTSITAEFNGKVFGLGTL